MTPIQSRVRSLELRFNNHRYETDGFTWDYTSATDEQVFVTAQVDKDTIEGLSQIILKIIKPQHRQKLREQIAYLIGLRHRQAEVWEKYLADCETRTNNVKQWVQLHTR